LVYLAVLRLFGRLSLLVRSGPVRDERGDLDPPASAAGAAASAAETAIVVGRSGDFSSLARLLSRRPTAGVFAGLAVDRAAPA
jgi:hypothetical protein